MGTISKGFPGSGGGTPVPAFASTAEAQAGSNATTIMSPLGVALKLRHDLGEMRKTGFRRYTGNVNNITVGHFAFAAANAPFVQTVYIRAHTAAEHAEVLAEMTAGSVGIITQSETVNTLSRFAVIAVIPVSGSDVPIIRALAVYHVARGTFSNDTDCNLDVLGSIKSQTLKSFDSKLTYGGQNVPLHATNWTNVPHRNQSTEVTSDNRMEVYMSSAAGGINTTLSVISGWIQGGSTSTKKCNARVRWSTDNGSTWNYETELTNIYHAQLPANLPIAGNYQIRPNVTGKVIVNWQIRRVSDTDNNADARWWPDFQFAQAVEI